MEINNDAYCDSAVFLVTGIDENTGLSGTVKVFPNPAKNSFILSCDIPIYRVKMVNTVGLRVKEIELNTREWEMSIENLPAGIYFVSIETEKGTFTKKVLKN